jgi:hypothetical protein
MIASKLTTALLLTALCGTSAFAPSHPALPRPTSLSMTLDNAMKSRLEGIRRSYQALTERLADPDVIADSNLLMQVMKDRSLSEEVVMAFNEVRTRNQAVFDLCICRLCNRL